MKDYYQILGVRRGASLPEIRRAYRILVQRLHPDINPEPAAHELIKEVNEAYDVLSESAKKAQYDYQLENPYSTIDLAPQEPVHRDPYFRRKERPAYRAEKSERIKMMEKMLSFFKWVYRGAAVFCFVLLVDFLVPRAIATEHVEGFYEVRKRGRYGRGSHHQANLIETNTGRTFQVEIEETKFFEDDPVVLVYETRILSITTKIETESKSFATTNFASVYNNFFFLPLLIGIGSIIGLTVKKGTLDFNFSLGLVILVLFGLTIKLMV